MARFVCGRCAGIEQPHDGIRELGLKLRRDGSSLRVENVVKGFPAFFAGLERDDELVKLRVPRPGSSESEWVERAEPMESRACGRCLPDWVRSFKFAAGWGSRLQI